MPLTIFPQKRLISSDPPTTLTELRRGKQGTAQTLTEMSRIVKEHGRTDPEVRAVADHLTRHLPQKDKGGEIRALYEFVRDRIRYSWDTAGLETLQWPAITLKRGQGDCDDKSILLASLLAAKGHPTRFIAVGLDPSRPTYVHVYVETVMGRRMDGQRRWVPLETTEPVDIGWKPEGVTRAIVAYNK